MQDRILGGKPESHFRIFILVPIAVHLLWDGAGGLGAGPIDENRNAGLTGYG